MMAGVPPLSTLLSVPIHWSDGSGVVPPPEVAKTVVAASEPRLPRTVTVVEMGAPVGLLNESMVRAKSWLPTLGTVTAGNGQSGQGLGRGVHRAAAIREAQAQRAGA